MTALADHLTPQHGRGSYRGPGGAGTGPVTVPGQAVAADRPGTIRDHARTVRSWPLLLLAFPAAAEVWSGWVGIAQETGFGRVSLLPGIWSSLHLDTTITLPIGVEAYAAYALRAWLASEPWISPRTRRFAKWSAICSFLLGMAGQVAYHLLVQAGESRAPWGITTVVSCLPVLVLAMGTALAHLLRGDATAQDSSDSRSAGPSSKRSPDWSAGDQPAVQPDQDHGTRTTVRTSSPARTSEPARPDSAAPPSTDGQLVPGPLHQADEQALRIARALAAASKPVSRRTLRSGGVKGSNERLNALARQLNSRTRERHCRSSVRRHRPGDTLAGRPASRYDPCFRPAFPDGHHLGERSPSGPEIVTTAWKPERRIGRGHAVDAARR